MDISGRIAALLGRVWWMPVLRGALLVVLGLLTLVEPLGTLAALRWVFGIFLVVDGFVVLIHAFLDHTRPGLGLWIAEALVSIAFGLIVMWWPGVGAMALFYLLALWALTLGVLALLVCVTQFRVRDLGWVSTLVFGLIAFLFGILLVIKPQQADTVLAMITTVFGLFALVSGGVMIVIGFATRSLGRQVTRAAGEGHAAGGPGTGQLGS